MSSRAAMQRTVSEQSWAWSDRSAGGSSFSDATLNNDLPDQEDAPQTFEDGPWQDDSRIWIPACNPAQTASHTHNSQRRHRTLVLCFDGTGDECDSENSNIVNLVAMLKKHDNNEQLVYYQPGVGTYTNSIVKVFGLTPVDELVDQMIAIHLATHIKAGYEFLMQNYTKGDKICIFGFSRGAYTARALAGMLQKVGLLTLCNYQQVPFAYELFKRTDEDSIKICETFQRTFCRTVRVEFMGVWETVASVGTIPQYLPFISEDDGIRYLRHGLSLDERRVKFLPTFCVDPREKEEEAQISSAKPSNGGASPEKEMEDRFNKADRTKTDVLQVWFAGVHTGEYPIYLFPRPFNTHQTDLSQTSEVAQSATARSTLWHASLCAG
ncbi:hypothetical protein NM688_g7989 [Phlebia brevispora]|uniref:Uncharacterized protein n=1 Tax=Phlebia brevispora TaxID=194682 RepID=A0ACC1RYT6_9APHY|nr:hypothetical protein NM688_g7989 [Phlebia brevispora]